MPPLSFRPDVPVAEAWMLGRGLRSTLRRRDQAELRPLDRDPVAIIESQHATRLAHLVPIRIGRMLESPFAYYRGTAAVMAADLADAPRTDHHVVICGDAHIANFGLFASPERRVLFDLNDFDEASVGPWEWDVKRMATSVVLAARAVGASEAEAADATLEAVSSYRRVIARLTERTVLSGSSSRSRRRRWSRSPRARARSSSGGPTWVARATGSSLASGSCRRSRTRSSAGPPGPHRRRTASAGPSTSTGGSSVT